MDIQSNAPDYGRKPFVRALMQILWPAFAWSAVQAGILFSLIDPLKIEFVQEHLGSNRQAAYTIGFLMSWAVITGACLTTWFLVTRINNVAEYS